MIPYSLLDLSPVPEGSDAAQALAQTVALARQAEALGYRRFWLAEHHNMPGIASAATAVVIGHVAGATRTIRVGAGGIMLPNHAPLVVAEQFGTLATLYPGRIDLGLGRAPGTDGPAMRALRRGMEGADRFPEDVAELIAYLGPPRPGAAVRAFPGEGTEVPVWVLGSSLYGAQVAAAFGLPFAFASHFAPAMLEEALAIYRARFRPGALAAPHAMMAIGVCAAGTDAEAEYLRTSQELAFARLRSGHPGKLPFPVARIEDEVPPALLAQVRAALSVSAVGGPGRVRDRLAALIARYRPDEVILTGMIHDPAARLRSFALAAEAMAGVAVAAG